MGVVAYQWWKFIHLAGIFGFLISHGVSVAVAFRVRKERDPTRVTALLQLSGLSVIPFYVSLLVLVVAGAVMGFLVPGHWWSFYWIWVAIGVLVLTMAGMYAVASPYYRKIRLVAAALAEGSEAVTPEQFAALLSSSRMWVVTVGGFVGLGLLLWLMMLKPFGTF